MRFTEKQYIDILDIGIKLSIEKDYNRIFELIIEKAMDITHSDGGTLYMVENDALRFQIMRTVSLQIYRGGRGEHIELPPVPLKEENVCAYAALHKEVINIQDVYHSDKFDFSGPKNYDAMTGYRTVSMLVLPLMNHESEVIGVLQLINAQDENDQIVAYDSDYERIILSLASQAALSLSNMSYIQEIKDILYSFAETMSTIVDNRTPYNGNHTRNVVKYTTGFVDYLNVAHEGGCYQEMFDKNRKEQLVLAASLHDIGKMTIPRTVMNKKSRLARNMGKIRSRYELLRCYFCIDYYEKRIGKEQYEASCKELDAAEALIERLNGAGFVTDEDIAQVEKLAMRSYQKKDGERICYLTPYERDCLSIRRGTLTDEERRIMESHVRITGEILSNVSFNRNFRNVPLWAGAHHEFLNGEGYPNHLTAEHMPAEIRILTIIDIFDALTARDRPYKSEMSLQVAFDILHSMVSEGKLDGQLVDLFEQYAYASKIK